MKRKLAWWAFVVFCLFLSLSAIFFSRFSTQVLELLPGRIQAVQALAIYERFFVDPESVVILMESSQPLSQKQWKTVTDPIRKAAAPGMPLQEIEPSHLAAEENPTLAAAGFLSLPEKELRGLLELSGKPPPATSVPSSKFVILDARLAKDRVTEARAWLQAEVSKASAEAGIAPGILNGEITGKPVFAYDVRAYLQSQLVGTFFSTILAGFAVGWLLTRDVRPFSFMVWMSLISVAGTLVFLQLFFGRVNGVAVGFASIMYGLAVDYAILVHFGAHEEVEFPWYRRRLVRALIGGWGTTVAVFIILLKSEFPGLRQLGAGVAVGMTICMTGTILWCLKRSKSKEAVNFPITPAVVLEAMQKYRVEILSALLTFAVLSGICLWRDPAAMVDLSAKRIQPPIAAQNTLERPIPGSLHKEIADQKMIDGDTRKSGDMHHQRFSLL